MASVTGSTATWFSTRVGAYGPLPGTQAATLTDITQLAASTAWRGRRIDPTGFYDLGARYYEPTSGRFLSADPFGHSFSPSLYDYCGGDPVNHFDPDGRCPNSNPIAPPFPPIPTPIPAPTPNPPPVVNYPAPNPAPTNYPTPVPAPPPDPTIGGQNPSDPNNDPSIFAGVPTAAVRGLAGFANRWTGGLFGSFGADPTSSEFQAGKTVGTYTAATAAVVGVAYVAATYGAAIVARGVITALPYLPAAVEVAPATEVAIASVEGAEGVGLAGEEIAGSAVEETSAAAEEASAGAAAPPQ